MGPTASEAAQTEQLARTRQSTALRATDAAQGGLPLAAPAVNLGMLHARESRLPDAEAALAEGIRRDPQSAVAFNELAAVQGGTHQCWREGTLVNHSTSAGEETWPIEDGGPAVRSYSEPAGDRM